MNFKKVSLGVFIIYTICIGGLLLNAIGKSNPDWEWKVQAWHRILQVLIWILIVTPQLILFQYVTNFKTRWAQLVSLILQITAFVVFLYNHGKVLFLMNIESQPVSTLISLPIWQIVTILALGLIMKLIQEY